MNKTIYIVTLLFAAGLSTAAVGETALPHHRAGLWQNDMVVSGKDQTNQSCFDDAYETQMAALAHKVCTAHSVTHNPDGSWTTTGTCAFLKGKLRTSASTITGDFNTKLVTKTHLSAAMPDVVITSTWVGPCKPGQRGGDVIASNGSKVNMLDVMSAGKLK